MRRMLTAVFSSAALLFATAVVAQTEALSPALELPGAFDAEQAERLWRGLSARHFAGRPIEERQRLIALQAPSRTENDAFVPVQIDIDTGAGRPKVERVYLFVDINPMPLGGKFELNPGRPLRQLSTRVRVNGYTYVRAIAETGDGALYMDKQLVKSRGVACAAPPITSPEDAARNFGKMRFKMLRGARPGEGDSVQLMISHPNATGMQKDQVSLLYIPEHYVKTVEVSFNDEPVLHAETTFTISENPSFRFGFESGESGELRARITDTRENIFVVSSALGADAIDTAAGAADPGAVDAGAVTR